MNELLAKLLMERTPLGGATKIAELKGIAAEARDASGQAFPEQGWNETQRNAYRHALGMGRAAQALGADQGGIRGKMGGLAAKGLGYGWEAMDGFGAMNGQGVDTRHDLNNNAVGIAQAQALGESGLGPAAQREILAQQLKLMAEQSRVEQPPGIASSARQHMTRTK